MKTVVHPKDSVKLCPPRNVFTDFGSFLFQALIILRNYHRIPYKKWTALKGLVLYPTRDLIWVPSRLAGALGGDQLWLRRCRAEHLTVLFQHPESGLSKKLTLQLKKLFWTCSKQSGASLWFATARSNLNWVSKIRQHLSSPKHHCVLVEEWKMKVKTRAPETNSRSSAGHLHPGHGSLHTPHITDPRWSLTHSKDLSGFRLNEASNKVQKNVAFIRRWRSNWDNQFIPTETNQEYLHRRFLSKNKEEKESQKHQLLLFLHHFLSYCFDA